MKKQFLFSPLAIPLESSISLYRCVADLAGNTSIGGGGLKEGGGMPPCYDFTTSPLYSATTAQLSFPSHFLFHKIHFPRPAGLLYAVYLSVCLCLFSCGRGTIFLVAVCSAEQNFCDICMSV